MKAQLQALKENNPLNNTELVATIRLLLTNNIGPATYFDLIKIYGSAVKACEELSRTSPLNRDLKLAPLSRAKQEIEQTLNFGASFIHINQPHYPQLLKHIYNPPPVLTVFGNVKLLNQPSVSVVGARAASANSINYTKQIGSKLSDAGFVTVSGLAIGIDTAVHQSSLTGGTIAVLAGGIDVLYPPENAKLQQQIIEQGLLITEMPFATQPTAKLFPRRNRIISGLAPLTVVMEATLKSGTLHTANFALNQNRMVAALPGSPLDPRARGNNHLLKQGAHLVENAEDIIALLKQQPLLSESDSCHYHHPSATNVNMATFVERVDINNTKTKILGLLDLTPIEFDQLVKFVNTPLPTVLLAIVELELEEKITRHYSNCFSLNVNNDYNLNYDPEYEEECI